MFDAADLTAALVPCEPTKIVCIGLNYVAHVRESLTVMPGTQEPPQEPLFFLKPPSAVLAPGGEIVKPTGLVRLDPEGEMALVIGRRARGVSRERALEYVAGVTAFNDVSARDWQKSDGQWARAKGSDTFAPFGPCIALGLDPRDLALELRVNGDLRQTARTSEMHFDPAFLVTLPVCVFSIVTHECAHGLAALACGDTTARDRGRLTLNPIPHVDPLGSVVDRKCVM